MNALRKVSVVFVAAFATLLSFGQSKSPVRPKANSPHAQTSEVPVAIKGGKLLTITHGTIENGVLIMQNGKIVAVGSASTAIPKGAQVIDATGMTVYPGLIDSETSLGLTEIMADQSTNDTVEPSDAIMPHMHVSDAFHAESELIRVTRVNGITNAIVAPGGTDTLPGQDAFIQLDGASPSDMLLVRDVAMPLNFTGSQRRKGGMMGEGSHFPSTRMGVIAQLRQTLLDAQDYQQKWAEYETKNATADKDKKPTPPKRDLKLEALIPYLEGKKTVVIAADEPQDLEVAVRVAKEFHLKFVLNHLTHTQQLLDYVASLKVPVIVGSIYEEPREDERYDTVFKLPAELQKRGVKIAFASFDAHNVRNLPYAAGYAVAWGLPYDEALKALTITPAEIWGVSDQLGSLDVGKTANVVLASGDPLDVSTDVKKVFIRGKEVPMTNRQIQLRDEYTK